MFDMNGDGKIDQTDLSALGLLVIILYSGLRDYCTPQKEKSLATSKGGAKLLVLWYDVITINIKPTKGLYVIQIQSKKTTYVMTWVSAS